MEGPTTTKFQPADQQFISRREKFFSSVSGLDAKFAVDNWPMLAGHVPIGTLLARYEIVKSTVSVPGHVLEFGVFNGANLLLMAKILDLLAPHSPKQLFGFDSFKGLTEFSEQDKTGEMREGQYAGELRLLRSMIDMHGLSDRCFLVNGLIEETLRPFLENNRHHLYSLIYLDTDLYESTKLALEQCWPRLAEAGRIVFDEGYHDRFPGEGIAVQEFLRDIKGEYTMGSVPFARQPMFWIQKK